MVTNPHLFKEMRRSVDDPLYNLDNFITKELETLRILTREVRHLKAILRLESQVDLKQAEIEDLDLDVYPNEYMEIVYGEKIRKARFEKSDLEKKVKEQRGTIYTQREAQTRDARIQEDRELIDSFPDRIYQRIKNISIARKIIPLESQFNSLEYDIPNNEKRLIDYEKKLEFLGDNYSIFKEQYDELYEVVQEIKKGIVNDKWHKNHYQRTINSLYRQIQLT